MTARIRMLVAEMTIVDGQATGFVETTVTAGGRTVSERREVETEPAPKPKTRRRAVSSKRTSDA